MRGRGAVAYQEPLPLFTRDELISAKGAAAAREGLSPICCPYTRPTYQLAWLRGYSAELHRQVNRPSPAGAGPGCRA